MPLRASLGERPVIYEIVPPRRDTSRFSTELRGVEEVFSESRITAINIPELINRREEDGRTVYSPATIPPEEYAMMIKDYKESIVNIIAPRLPRDEFLSRARKVTGQYRIPNLILVGKERHEDSLPGPSVTEAMRLLSNEKEDSVALGGICIFGRDASGADNQGRETRNLPEPKRVWLKADAGCDFVTSQITFESKPAVDFFRAYQVLCEETEKRPVTVFVSIATVPSPSILTLLESLDVVIPAEVRRRLTRSRDMGMESIRVASEVFDQIASSLKDEGVKTPIGLQIEQVGVNSGQLSLELLNATYPILKGF